MLLILAFKRRFRAVFWFIQYRINLHSLANSCNMNISSIHTNLDSQVVIVKSGYDLLYFQFSVFKMFWKCGVLYFLSIND